MFIKYCVFSELLKILRTLFSLGVSVCTHTRQVEHQRCSRTGRVQKNHNIWRKRPVPTKTGTVYLNSSTDHELCLVQSTFKVLWFGASVKLGASLICIFWSFTIIKLANILFSTEVPTLFRYSWNNHGLLLHLQWSFSQTANNILSGQKILSICTYIYTFFSFYIFLF